MKILISDSLSQQGIDLLTDQEIFTVDLKTDLTPKQLVDQIGDYDALIIRSSTQVTADVISATTKLKVIGRAGVGIDNIDVPAATQKGVLVFNTPAGNTVAAAEHTITLMLALSRHILNSGTSLKNREWDRKRFIGSELYRKTFGVIGLGRIGSEVVKRVRAFGMRIIAHDPYVSQTAAKEMQIELMDRDELIRTADYISIHIPLTEETYHTISDREFKMMKPTCRLINCARGGLVDEDALYRALKSGEIAGAAFDVFENEPLIDHRLTELDNFLGTPHLGASTAEAQKHVAIEVAQKVIDVLNRLPIENAVNQPKIDHFEAFRSYLILAERLGGFQAQIVDGQISEIRIRYSGDLFAKDVTLISVAVQAGLLKPVLQSEVNYVNAPYLMKRRGIRVSETKRPANGNFSNSITVSVITDRGKHSIEGTAFGSSDVRIVRINDLHLNAKPEGYMLLIYNQDQPGMIGLLGTILGDHGINIADMTVGRQQIGSIAITLINVDSRVPRSVIDEICSEEKIEYVKQIKL